METIRLAPSVPFGCFNVTIGAVAKTLAELVAAAGHPSISEISEDAQHFFLFAEDGDVRWTDDGHAPEAAVGILLTAGNAIDLKCDKVRMAAHQFIRVGAADVACSLWIGG